MKITKEYTYNDISLFSREISTINSRFNKNIKTTKTIRFGNDDIEVGFLMSAPMYDVTGEKMMIAMLNEGELPVVHRFMSAEQQLEIFDNVLMKTNYNEKYIYSYSIGIFDSFEKLDRLEGYLRTLGSGKLNILICIDTANGSNILLENIIGSINKIKQNNIKKVNMEIITGNVVTKEACEFLYKKGVRFVRCGISSGSVCSTSVVTGIYRPPVSMLSEIYEWKKSNNINDFYIVADGGIKGTDDIMKAIASGADFVMSGRFFAGYEESNSPLLVYYNEIDFWSYKSYEEYFKKNLPTNTTTCLDFNIFTNHVFKKYYRGMASFEMAELNNKINNINKPIIPEGVADYVEYKQTFSQDINKIKNAVRSSMSYANAYNFDEYRQHIEIVEITENSHRIRRPDIYN